MLGKVAIVGRPNVGKSTLFNRIIGQRLSITDSTPGVTRDRIYAKGEWLGHEFNLIDTGGIEISDAPFQVEIQAQAEVAMEEADVIIMLCDSRSGVTDDDTYIAKLLYRSNKPVILAVNKVDDLFLQTMALVLEIFLIRLLMHYQKLRIVHTRIVFALV